MRHDLADRLRNLQIQAFDQERMGAVVTLVPLLSGRWSRKEARSKALSALATLGDDLQYGHALALMAEGSEPPFREGSTGSRVEPWLGIAVLRVVLAWLGAREVVEREQAAELQTTLDTLVTPLVIRQRGMAPANAIFSAKHVFFRGSAPANEQRAVAALSVASPSLERLSVSSWPAPGEEQGTTARLAVGLSAAHWLLTLDLSFNRMSNEAHAMLARAVGCGAGKGQGSLRSVCLNDTGLDPDSASAWAAAIRTLRSLMCLELGDNPRLGANGGGQNLLKEAQRLPELQIIGAERCRLSFENVSVLLPFPVQLQELRLHGNKLSPREKRELLEAGEARDGLGVPRLTILFEEER